MAVLQLLLAAVLITCSNAAAEEAPVIRVTSSNFDELTRHGEWLLTFSAPWCVHCRNLEPTWRQVASRLAGRVNVAKVNADEEMGLVRRLPIEGFPAIFFIRPGETHAYQGDRTEEDLVHFATEGWRYVPALSFFMEPSSFVGRMWAGLLWLPGALEGYHRVVTEDLKVPVVVIVFCLLAVPLSLGLAFICMLDLLGRHRARSGAHLHQS